MHPENVSKFTFSLYAPYINSKLVQENSMVFTSHNETRQYKMLLPNLQQKKCKNRQIIVWKWTRIRRIMVLVSIATASATTQTFSTHHYSTKFLESVFQALLLHQLSVLSSYLLVYLTI